MTVPPRARLSAHSMHSWYLARCGDGGRCCGSRGGRCGGSRGGSCGGDDERQLANAESGSVDSIGNKIHANNARIAIVHPICTARAA